MQASAPVVTPTPKVVLIDVYGDDAMIGMTSMLTITQQSEPADTQTILQAQYPGVAITNHATGGTSSSLMNEMNGVDGNGAPFAQRILLSKADIVLDNHVMNDALDGETVDDYRGYLVQWVQAVRSAGKIAVLEEPNPVCDGNHPQLPDYIAAMDDVAAQMSVPIVTQYQYVQTIPNWQSHLSGCFYPDESIYALKAQRQAAGLAPLVQSLVGSGS